MADPTTIPPRVLETAVYVDDLDAAEAFYGALLGLEKVGRVGDRHIFYRCGQGMLLVFNPEETRIPPRDDALPVPPHGSVGEGHMCFGCDGTQLEALAALFAREGVEIESDFRWPNGARSIYVRDPAGNSIEFAEPRLWGFDE
jgi:catechol 2,3-dioxygenase-like lactoylglutathione lyase family enzyme